MPLLPLNPLCLDDRDERHTSRSKGLDTIQHERQRRNAAPIYDSYHTKYKSKSHCSDIDTPLNDDDTPPSTRRGRDGNAPTCAGKPTNALLRPQISLSNFFETDEPPRGQYDHKIGQLKESHLNTAKGRLRSLSDTSLSPRLDQGNYDVKQSIDKRNRGQILEEGEAGLHKRKNHDNQKTAVAYSKMINKGNKNRQILTDEHDQDTAENATISLTEFAKLEKVVPMKQ